jgi:hypothetical protein
VVHSQIERFSTMPLLFAFWRGRRLVGKRHESAMSGRGVLFGNPAESGKKPASPLGPKRSAGRGLALSGAPTTIGSPAGKQIGAGADAQPRASLEISRRAGGDFRQETCRIVGSSPRWRPTLDTGEPRGSSNCLLDLPCTASQTVDGTRGSKTLRVPTQLRRHRENDCERDECRTLRMTCRRRRIR